MRRIVKEKLKSGKIRFRVETNRMLCVIPCSWRTEHIYDAERDRHFDAVFSTYDEALSFCGVETDTVENREILAVL